MRFRKDQVVWIHAKGGYDVFGRVTRAGRTEVALACSSKADEPLSHTVKRDDIIHAHELTVQ